MSDLGPPTALIATLVRLRQTLVDHDLPFEAGGVESARHERESLIKQLDDYVIPRLVQIEAPLLTVVGGSTGAGKSTLVNTLVGSRVSEPGVLRPTTRSPVLVHNPDDAHWFGTDRLLPDLVRTDHATHDQGTLQLVPSIDLPPGLAILDAPDVDSVEERNRVLAAQLLSAADLWLFVTSAARYADQVPWDFLKAAAERSTAVAVVLDRTTPSARPRGEQPPRADAHHARARRLAAVHRPGVPGRRRRPAAALVGHVHPELARQPRRRQPCAGPGGAQDAGRRRPLDRSPHPRRVDRDGGAGEDLGPAARRRGQGVRRPAGRVRRRHPGRHACCGERCWRAGRSSSVRAS